jgi:hypothetical protein
MGMVNGLFGNLGQQANTTFTIRSGIGGNELMGSLGSMLRGMGPIGGLPGQFGQNQDSNQTSNNQLSNQNLNNQNSNNRNP